MKRTIGFAVSALAVGALVAGCGSDSGSDDVSTNNAAAVVKVEGADLPGLDAGSVTCVKQNGKINVASGAIGSQQAVTVVMSEGNPPKVDALTVVVEDSALAVAPGAGSAEVAVDGDKYTITGTAVGADMKNPTAGMLEKKFEIVVECK
ncbi:lipoprotein LpqH [Gordonia sp. PDNC005]|uniref:lipoprotein LpqH n=1 Tax=unclassified Gordonia (in: high G+C Gram-positive bacteria) TaxID=2657482 RepID=UPI001962546F|nr:lipoprotein LpqH [Gordonia sp. PDNC005]QRY63765.1 lipoprotein LpqH [Gordonia sp. PDNC005]